MSFIVLSDIHANLTALKAVINDFQSKYQSNEFVLLGDIINYGMRPNEVITLLQQLPGKIIINLYGNHEWALRGNDIQKFSTERGKAILHYTKSHLSSDSLDFIIQTMNPKGYEVISIADKNVLFIHGSLDDPYWGKLNPSMAGVEYSKFDYVISGHSHIPCLIEKYYPIEDSRYRNKKRTVFINPGSVGQPRNHNPRAQYAYIDIENEVYHFNSVSYDIKSEQLLYPDFIDPFYKKRLTLGI